MKIFFVFKKVIVSGVNRISFMNQSEGQSEAPSSLQASQQQQQLHQQHLIQRAKKKYGK